jgi:hypothetical protein
MKRPIRLIAFGLLLCTSALAQNYTFMQINNPNDPNNPFTQLL